MQTVRTNDADIAWRSESDGDPLLLIMGLMADSRMWMLQAPAFATTYRVITFDNRGVGASSSPRGPYTMEQMATDALAVLDAAGVERAHVVGVSMGGAIAQHVALDAPERVRSLVLAATWCRPNPYHRRLATVGRMIAENLGSEALVRASMLWVFSPGFFLEAPDTVEAIETMFTQFQPDPTTFGNQLHAVETHDTRDRLGGVRAPTLVVAGRRDILVPPELSREVADAIPGARFLLLETGHGLQFEEVNEFNRAVLGFLADH